MSRAISLLVFRGHDLERRIGVSCIDTSFDNDKL